MGLHPGQTNNPLGRPVGSRNKRTQEIFEFLEGRGDKDPIDYLSDIVTNGKDEALRITAANYLLPYKHSKRSTAPTPRFIEDPTVVPEFTSIEQAENFLAEIPRVVGRGELDFQAGLDLSAMTKNWIDAQYAREELRLKIASQGGGAEQHIVISGGMPIMPGLENVIMPGQEPTNSHALNGNRGPVIEHQTPTQSEAPDAST
jgi:hypothetical protein